MTAGGQKGTRWSVCRLPRRGRREGGDGGGEGLEININREIASGMRDDGERETEGEGEIDGVGEGG